MSRRTIKEAVSRMQSAIEDVVEALNDADYCEALEEIESYCSSSIAAKREEEAMRDR